MITIISSLEIAQSKLAASKVHPLSLRKDMRWCRRNFLRFGCIGRLDELEHLRNDLEKEHFALTFRGSWGKLLVCSTCYSQNQQIASLSRHNTEASLSLGFSWCLQGR